MNEREFEAGNPPPVTIGTELWDDCGSLLDGRAEKLPAFPRFPCLVTASTCDSADADARGIFIPNSLKEISKC